MKFWTESRRCTFGIWTQLTTNRNGHIGSTKIPAPEFTMVSAPTTMSLSIQTGQMDLSSIIPKRLGKILPNTRTQGEGGVDLSSFIRKFAYMLKFNNALNFILPGEIESTSRVLYNRNIKERVSQIAPFLKYDADPYLVLHNGRLIWMIDAYTTTARYPYSAPMQDTIRRTIAERGGRRAAGRIMGGERPWGNYIRNAAKVTIDAYDGSVNFYLMEREQDPIAECYRRIFRIYSNRLMRCPKILNRISDTRPRCFSFKRRRIRIIT